MADKINGPIPTLPTAGNGWQMGPGGSEPKFFSQVDPINYTGTAETLSTAALLSGIITSTNAGAAAKTLPLATDLDAALPNAVVNSAFDFSIQSSGNTMTLTTNTGWTLVGTMTVATTVTGRFRARKTGVGAWSVYRMA